MCGLCTGLLDVLQFSLVAAKIFEYLDNESGLALRSCGRQLRAAGYLYIHIFSVRLPGEGVHAAFIDKLEALQAFKGIRTLALVNFNEAFLEWTAAAIAVSAQPLCTFLFRCTHRLVSAAPDACCFPCRSCFRPCERCI
jgi:hypothetical protein